ncbi:MAG: hypothetical protein RL264_531 [Bacteroidota bacterium]|jgi:hypothetical protein
MKKVYLSLALMTAFGVSAQKHTSKVAVGNADRTFVGTQKKVASATLKNEGDILWQNGFDNASDWNQTLGPGQSANTGSNPGWQLVTAIPTTISSQQAQYGWPATFSGASGNFAFIDSDAAGASGTQDAYFEFATPIDLSAAGNAFLYLTFSEYYRNFYDQTFVEVSNDGGVTWVEFEANPEAEVPVNTNCVAGEVEVINITSVIGSGTWSNNVKVRFHYVGAWDWFWGVDDVKIVEAWQNDVKVVNAYAGSSAAQGLDYFTIDNSQVDFPGLTFGAIVNNNGAANQTSVALKATATEGYDQTGTSITLAAGATDSVSISSPYDPTTVGAKTINLTTVLAGTDSQESNNTASMVMEVSNTDFGRDNGVATGSISNVSSNTGNPLKIGNVMDIYNAWSTTGAKVRLATQAQAAVGSEYWIEVQKFDGTSYVYLAETEKKTVAATAATWSSLKWIDGDLTNGKLNLSAGDDILLLACHAGGTSEVRFGYAQNTYEQTVLGYTSGATDPFYLQSPGAMMVRLTDDPVLSVNETVNTLFSVYPNPANELINIKLANGTNGSVVITDLSGKTVATSTIEGNMTAVSTSNLNNGVYMVTVTTGNSTTTEKVVIRK